GNPGQQMGSRTGWLPDGKADSLPWQTSATRASAWSTRTRRCSSTRSRRLGALRSSRIALRERGADRAGLRSALDYVRDTDVLIVWKLDRLGRSLPHLIETVTSLATRGVGFRSITEAIDTTTPGGRL